MSAISRWLDRFCYKHPGFGIPNLMKVIVLGNVAVFLLDMFSGGGYTLSGLLCFYPELIFQGQVWRIITFIFVPMYYNIIFFVITTMLYYFLGSALERQWGTARFSVFYGLGVLMSIVVGLVTWFISPMPAASTGYYLETATAYYVNMSLFFAFATLYPDMQMMLYFIIPVKIKWLAWLDAALFAFDIGSYLARGQFMWALLPLVALLNYFIFFWDDLMGFIRRTGSRAAYRARPQTINFKKATRQVQERQGYLHKCAVCGITDADDPDMEFRYCSKCNGYYCYCSRHINDHVHVK